MTKEFKASQAAGEKVEAELVFLGEEIKPQLLDRKIGGKIIGGVKVGKTALVKAGALDAAGMVVADLSTADFEEVYGKQEEIGEEFYRLAMPLLVISQDDLLLLKENNGKKVILDPSEKKLVILD